MPDDPRPARLPPPGICDRAGVRWTTFATPRGMAAHRLATNGRLRFVTGDDEAGLLAAMDADAEGG